MTIVWVLVGVLGFLLALWLTAGAVLMQTATARHVKPMKPPAEEENCYRPFEARIQEEIRWFNEQNPEEWHITSFDGLRLRARYLAHQDARGTIVCMHGYRGDPLWDFGVAAHFYHEAGYNVLVPDERAHWQSEGSRITYGVRERFDCRDWARAVNERNGGAPPIFLHGLSMGAGTVLMAAGLALPDNVRGVIADCGFTSPDAIFRYTVRNSYRLPAGLLVPAASLFMRLFAGFSTRGASTIDAMRTNRLPILFLHGTDDNVVPFSMTEQNYAACRAPKELVAVPGAKHAQCLHVEPDRCRDRILLFFP